MNNIGEPHHDEMQQWPDPDKLQQWLEQERAAYNRRGNLVEQQSLQLEQQRLQLEQQRLQLERARLEIDNLRALYHVRGEEVIELDERHRQIEPGPHVETQQPGTAEPHVETQQLGTADHRPPRIQGLGPPAGLILVGLGFFAQDWYLQHTQPDLSEFQLHVIQFLTALAGVAAWVNYLWPRRRGIPLVG